MLYFLYFQDHSYNDHFLYTAFEIFVPMDSLSHDLQSSNRVYQPRVVVSSKLFTRIDTESSRCRYSKTSDAMRVLSNIPKNSVLYNSKENLSYAGYMSKTKSGLKFDEKAVVSKCLQALRKEYDKMTKSIKLQKSKINSIKKDIKLIKNKTIFLDSDISGLDQAIIEKENLRNIIAQKQEDVLMEAKMLANIIDRMKKDQIFEKNKGRMQAEQAKRLEKECKTHQEMVLFWDDNIHKLLEKEKKMKNICEENTEERERKLADYENRLQCLQDKEKFEFERKERTYQLLSIQTNDILDAKNLVMRDIYMTNKLLDKLLKQKIASLLMKYQNLQNAFHKIKTETSIYNPQELEQKFFSYNQLSESLLGTISTHEQKQKKLAKSHEKLKKRAHMIQSKNLEEEKSNQSFAQFRNKKNLFIKKITEKNLLIKKIKDWITKKPQQIFPAPNQEFSQSQTAHTLNAGHHSEILKQFCQNLLNEAFKLGCPEVLNQNKFQSSGIRVKKLIHELSIEQQKLRKSQAQQMNQNNTTETNYLTQQRQKIKRNHFLIKPHVLSTVKP